MTTEWFLLPVEDDGAHLVAAPDLPGHDRLVFLLTARPVVLRDP